MYDESLKYPYFPEINEYDLIHKNYYIINDIPYTNSITDRNFVSNLTSIIKNNDDFINKPFRRIKVSQKYSSNSALSSLDNFNMISPKIIMPKNNYSTTSKNSDYISKIKKKIDSLIEIKKKEEDKIKNRKNKIMKYKNTIPNNFKKKIEKSVTPLATNRNLIKYEIRQLNKSNNNIKIENSKNKKINEIKFELINNSSSSQLKKDSNDIYICQSNQSSEFLNEDKSTKINTKKNTMSLNNINKYELSPKKNNYNNINDGAHYNIEDYYQKNQLNSYSYKFLPKNEYSEIIKGRMNNNINMNIGSNIKKIIYKKINILNNKEKKKMVLINNKYKPYNSIVTENNSISTNFFDRPSQYENYNSILNENNQHSFIYHKFKKNSNYLIPSKNNNISDNNSNRISNITKNNNYIDSYILNNNELDINKNPNKKIIVFKNNKFQENIFEKKNSKKIFDKISKKTKKDNINDNYYYLKTNSPDKIKKDEKKGNYDEKNNNFDIIKKIDEDKKYTLKNLEITHGAVNENVKSGKKSKDKNKQSISEKSEPLTIQSMNDSKIFEIANYYLNEEETVDKIQINDILSSKNSKDDFIEK